VITSIIINNRKVSYFCILFRTRCRNTKIDNKRIGKIQTFPPNYFSENDSKKDVIMQIGNAVACKFAFHLGKYLIKKLSTNINNTKLSIEESKNEELEDEKPKRIKAKK